MQSIDQYSPEISLGTNYKKQKNILKRKNMDDHIDLKNIYDDLKDTKKKRKIIESQNELKVFILRRKKNEN